MIPALLLGLLSTGENTLLMHVVSPKGQASRTPTSALLGAADRALAKNTDLIVRSLEQLGVDPGELARCPSEERLGCWTRTLAAAGARPELLLILAVHPRPETQKDELYAILIDAAAASSAADRSAGDREALEQEIYAMSLESKPALVETSSTAALDRYFTNLVEHELRPVIERRGFWGRKREPPKIAKVVPPPPPQIDRKTIPLIAEAAVAAIGAGVAIYGVTELYDGTWRACLTRDATTDADCPKVRSTALQLGASFFVAGGVAALATWLFGQDDEFPWIQLGAGLAAGAITYAISAL
jgi:hypothetical protein